MPDGRPLDAPLECVIWASKLRLSAIDKLSMGGTRGWGDGGFQRYLDSVRTDHVDHDDSGADRQFVLRSHRLVFHRAILHVDLDLADAALVTWDSEINGPGLAD